MPEVAKVIFIFDPKRPSSGYIKMVLALGGSFAISVLMSHGTRGIVYGISGAGLAIVIHRLARLLMRLGDLVRQRFETGR